MAEELSEAEKFFRRVEGLALSTIPIEDGVLVAATNHHDGVMVAVVPDDPERFSLDVDNALEADDLHITLCYLGKAHQFDNFDRARILAAARQVCDRVGKAFSAKPDGVVVMGSNDEGVPATALLIQSNELIDLYDAMADALNYRSNYPSYIPHMTSGYGVSVEDAQEHVGETITFSNVIVKFGDDKHVIPLVSSLVAAPRGANVIDRVVDSLGRLWDEALHPRGDDGRFIKKNGAVSGKLFVPNLRTKDVKHVDANRASVVGFHTFDNDVWVLAEITNADGSKVQGFAKADEVRAVAPVKARLDALYPVTEDDAFIPSSTERMRQLDLILAHVTEEYGPNNDVEGARNFLDSLGLHQKDIDYIERGDDPEFLGGIRRIDRRLSPDELDEQKDIIEDTRKVKELRDRVHGLQQDAGEAHTVPQQRIQPEGAPESEAVNALQSGADPFSVDAADLLNAMKESGRFTQPAQIGSTGISPIEWLIDEDDQTGIDAYLAGTGSSTTGRAYFVKQSVMGADMRNTDAVREVLASLLAEQVSDSLGPDDDRPVLVPRTVFGNNPIWDGDPPDERQESVHQPAHVIAAHAHYYVPSDWTKTTIADEETALYNDIRNLDEAGQADASFAYYEDMGEVYGNDIAKMVLWDFLLQNGDRNPGNAILAAPQDGGEGRVVTIDHGFAFDNESPIDGVPNPSNDELFEWFMNYDFTKAWMSYVHGGIDLDTNVTESSIRNVFQDFIDSYSRMDVGDIANRFRAMPNVTDEQIRLVEQELDKVSERLQWMKDNESKILQRLTRR